MQRNIHVIQDNANLWSVSFTADPDLDVGEPVLLFQGEFKGTSGPWGRNYDLATDGEHFVMIKEEMAESVTAQIYVILNWSEK
ncbi:MAG: hypothetical protein E4H10_17495 [Bacteroidia bacterium]|nr:MAG: hypothetical protein E4H10_17495 [Bacteroidia bacterium]